MGMVRMEIGTAWGLLGNGTDGGSASQSLGDSSLGLGWPADSDGGTVGGFRGGSRLWDSFVSPRERIGRLSTRLGKSESRVQDDRRTSRPTGKSL